MNSYIFFPLAGLYTIYYKRAACSVCVLIIETLLAISNEFVRCENLPA